MTYERKGWEIGLTLGLQALDLALRLAEEAGDGDAARDEINRRLSVVHADLADRIRRRGNEDRS